MKKAINIRMDESLLCDFDQYAHELDRSHLYNRKSGECLF